MHGGGRSGRGIALILSGWRGFYTWLGKQGLIASNPVVDVRAPGGDAYRFRWAPATPEQGAPPRA